MATEVFPVVHVRDAEQALKQSTAALKRGADGVYLIDHTHATPDTLIESFNHVRERHPDSFIGLNLLQHSSSAQSLKFLLDSIDSGDMMSLPDGLWVDNAERDKEATVELRRTHPTLQRIRYLGGVAFKYTPLFTSNPGEAADEAVRLESYVDVVTTSGAGTGQAPSPEKIAAMKRSIGKKLAVASGISVENFANYDGHFDELLVSTSIETYPYSGVFAPAKLQELIDTVHQ